MKHKLAVQWVMSGDVEIEAPSADEARRIIIQELTLSNLEELGVCYLDDSITIEESESLDTDEG